MTMLPAVWGRRIRAAVPERAALILDRLTGVREPFPSLATLRAELEAAAARPLEISLARRAIHLAIQGFFLLPGLAIMLMLSSVWIHPRAFPWDLEAVVAAPLCWVLWAMFARGGLSFALAGIVLARNDGRRASAGACGLRALLVWAPPTILLATSRYLQETTPEASGLSLGLWVSAVVLLIAYLSLALLFPSRCVQDRLAQTVLVPM